MTLPRILRLAACLGFILECSFATGLGAEWPVEAGPLFHQFELTLDAGRRTEALGPLLSIQERPSERQWNWTPLFTGYRDESTDSLHYEVLWPALSYDRTGTEYRWQLGQLLSFSGKLKLSDAEAERFTIFPFYFQQRSTDPALNYRAVLPFYGTIKGRLYRDEIRFFLMPLYVQTTRRGVVTDNYLYPFFHLRRGESLRGWQLWPLIEQETKEATFRTNNWDELEVIGGHRKTMLFWPLVFASESGIGTTNTVDQQTFFPLFSLLRSPQRDSSSYLWPVFTWTEDRERGYREFDFLWPMVVFADGPGKQGSRILPFYSRFRREGLQRESYLWPIYLRNRAQGTLLDRSRTRIGFFVYSDLVEADKERGTARHRTDLWPLFSARRDHDGNERLQLLAILEPLLPSSTSVERIYSPLWSVWRSESNPKTGAKSQSLLWNLYRCETSPSGKKGSLLFGLIRYESSPVGKRWRLFYIPLGGAKPRSTPPPD